MLNRRRRTVRVLAGLALVLAGLLVALPLWWPWALKPAGKTFGLTYSRYDRIGYSGFRLTDASITNNSSRIRAERIEAFVPTAWLWKVITGETNVPFVNVQGWSYSPVISPSKTNDVTKAASVFTNVVQLRRLFAQLQTWAPHMVLSRGNLLLTDSLDIEIPRAEWLEGRLIATATTEQSGETEVSLETHSSPMKLSVAAPKRNLFGEVNVRDLASTVNFNGAVNWLSNRTELEITFAREGVIPSTAAVRADRILLPGSAMGFTQYQKVQGEAELKWNAAGLDGSSTATNRQFAIHISANAVPESEDLPPLDIDIQASGTTNEARIDTARVVIPWMTAELSEGTALRFAPPFVPERAELHVTIELSKQNHFPATGVLHGNATVFPSTNVTPRAEFQLTGEHLSVTNMNLRAVRLRGALDWPSLQLTENRVTLEDGSEASFTASLDVASNVVHTAKLTVRGAFARDLLPAGYSFKAAEVQADLRGPFTALRHSGELKLNELVAPGLRPLEVLARWQGTGIGFDDLQLEAASAGTTVEVNAAGAFSQTNVAASLSMFSLKSEQHGELRLETPVNVQFQRGASDETNQWRLSSDPLKLVGNQRMLNFSAGVEWPQTGNISIEMQNIGSELFEDFLVATNSHYLIRELQAGANWTNGPVMFTNQFAARISSTDQPEVELRGSVGSDSNRIVISNVSIASTTQVVCHVEGELPFAFEPAATNSWIQIRDEGDLRLRAFTETNSAIWDQLAAKLPIKLHNPNVRVDVSGSWRKPAGTLKADVERFEIRATKPLPVVTGLNLALEMDRENARANFGASIQDQPVRASATMPLGTGFWKKVLEERELPDFGEATGELALRDAKVSAFAEFAPELIAPQGEVSVNLKLSPGLQLAGEALVYNLTTRPLPSLGPVRSIDGQVLFEGSRLALTNFVAEIGGQRVRAHGVSEVTESILRERKLPGFELYVIGTNVPLVREASVLLRSDLNLAITNVAGSNGVIAGHVRLRDGFFLSSLKDLAPGKVSSPSRRPPYFSIEVEPFASWRLALNVEGDRFMKVQSPFFRGTVSTTLRIEGSLREPLALGEARINSGMITFPFGSLNVRQGFVSLTSANPYQPQLLVNAEAERMGYDIKMEATGPADQPAIQFSSSPPLTSEQIVLMLTTGQTPAGVATSTTTRQRAQGVAMFVGKNILSDLGFGGTGDGRLTIRSGEQVTESGRPTYDVEYKLDEDWSVVGEYDRFSQYNLGFKWRIYSK